MLRVHMSFLYAGPFRDWVMVVALPAVGITAAAATEVATVSPCVSKPTFAPFAKAVNEVPPNAVIRPAATWSGTVSVAVTDLLVELPAAGVSVTDHVSPATTGLLTVKRLAAAVATTPLTVVVFVPFVFETVGARMPGTRAMIVITSLLEVA